MREMATDERYLLDVGFDRDKQEGSPWDAYLWEQIARLKEAAVSKVLGGLDPVEYRAKLGYIAALSDVIAVSGELDERIRTVKDSLNAG